MNKIIFQLLFIVILLIFLLAIVHIFDTKEGYDTSVVNRYTPSFSVMQPPSVMPIMPPPPSTSTIASSYIPLTKYDPSNYNIQYHATAEDIQAQLDIDMSSNLVSFRDASGNIIKKPISQTTSDTTYYTSGTLKYNPINYVPNYEDTIYFSKLTGLGYQTPTINTNSQLSGFCKYDRYFPEKIEEKCSKLDTNTCASTTCCVLMGGKCLAGNYKGPYFKAHYGDLDLQNKDKYYYMGRCYGNCIDDQTNYYDYNVTTRQTFPGFAEDNPAFLPNISDYLAVVAPNSFNTALQNPNATISDMKCRIDRMGNLVDSTGSVIAYNATLDANGNFVDSNGHILTCSEIDNNIFAQTPVPIPVPVSPTPMPVSQIPAPVSPMPIPIPVSPTPVPLSPTPVQLSPTPVPVSPIPIPTPAPVSKILTPVSQAPAPVSKTLTSVSQTPAPFSFISPSPTNYKKV